MKGSRQERVHCLRVDENNDTRVTSNFFVAGMDQVEICDFVTADLGFLPCAVLYAAYFSSSPFENPSGRTLRLWISPTYNPT